MSSTRAESRHFSEKMSAVTLGLAAVKPPSVTVLIPVSFLSVLQKIQVTSEIGFVFLFLQKT